MLKVYEFAISALYKRLCECDAIRSEPVFSTLAIAFATQLKVLDHSPRATESIANFLQRVGMKFQHKKIATFIHYNCNKI